MIYKPVEPPPADAVGGRGTRDRWAILFIAVLGLALYAGILKNPFVWDDVGYIQRVPLYQNWKNIVVLASPSNFFRLTRAQAYRPVQIGGFFLNYALSGLAPKGWRLFSLALHIANALFLYGLVLRVSRQRITALMAAFLFVAHPAHHEALACATFQCHLECCLFFLLAFHADLANRGAVGSSSALRRLLAPIFYLGALLSTEMGVMYLPVLALYDYLFLIDEERDSPRRLFVRYGFHGGVTAFYIFLRFAIFKTPAGQSPGYRGGTFISNSLTVSKILIYQARLLLFPARLSADYPIQSVQHPWSPWFVAGFLLLTGTLGVVLWFRSRARELSFAMGWILLTLFPVMGFYPIWNAFAERYLYVPSIGFCWTLALLISFWERQSAFSRALARSFCVLLVLVYSLIAFNRNKTWRDPIALWSDAARQHPTSARAHGNLASEYGSRGFFDLAAKEAEEAVRLDPATSVQYGVLGMAYQSLRRLDAAERAYQAGLRVNPNDAEIHDNLAVLYGETGRFKEAAAEYKTAVSLVPNFCEAYTNWGVLDAQMAMLDEAIRKHRIALQLCPGLARAHLNLARSYLSKEMFSAAIVEFQHALALENNPLGLTDLGTAYWRAGIQEKALELWMEAARKLPQNSVPVRNLALARMERKEYAASRREFEALLQIEPHDVAARKALEWLRRIEADKTRGK